ncbi:MAG TPA: ornithine cyclodeaminase family protein [Actinomycetota bacterium]|nr:ornithine cyclodeaminase family protein [Actinomycetota bacterium]
MTRLLVLTDPDVSSLVGSAESVDVVERAFADFGLGRTNMPPKVYLDFPQQRGDLRVMPAAVGGRFAGVKLINSHELNPSRGLPAVVGTYVLFSQETGIPLCLMAATALTALRTGAASGVAARYLARPESSTLGLIGAGAQAPYQLGAVAGELPITETIVWAPDSDAARRDVFLQAMALAHPTVQFRAGSLEEAAATDVICTTTPARAPLFPAGAVRPGTHINAVGADGPGKQELDPALLKGARVIVDEIHQAVHGGEVNVPISRGLMKQDDIAGTLSDIVNGSAAGRTSAAEITIFDSTGLAIQDIAVAILAYERALELGVGSTIDL